MPWTETRPMQRLDFIRACHAGTDSFAAFLASAEKPATNGFNVSTLLTSHLSLTARARHTLTPGRFLMISSDI